jgi:thioredoxin 1
MEYGIEAIPTILIFRNGQPVQKFQGIPSKQKVQEAIDGAK